MNKKIISLVLALVMVLGTFTSVFAETTKKAEAKKAEAGEKVEKVVGKDNKIQYVIDKKLVEGYEDGDYGLDKNIKRSEITRLLVLANGNEELAKQLQGSMKIYSDVDAKHWANGVISVGTTVPSDANGIAMLAGYPDGSFKPENDVTYAELAKMLVVLAKKDLTAEMVKNAVWATSWMTWAAQLGILDDVNVVDSNKAANRADAFTMIYNALYTMKEFKRVPANETRGIISNLTKDVLTLNQDSKMEYKVTGETVFVTGKDAVRQQVTQLKDLDVKVRDYYLGSLVRILTNEKNEVTHIIELGNPKELARETVEGKVAFDNTVWKGVAENTVETVNFPFTAKTAKDAQDKIKANDTYATVKFNANNIDAKYVVFHNVMMGDKKVNTLDLKINDKTEFYVANPANKQMKKVANVNEALALIGFHNYDGYKLAGVYAGFDTDGMKANYKAIKFNENDRHTAKVVVFNFVNKAAEGEKFRVIESSSSKFMTTLEKTDGTLVERNNVYDTSRFPLEYGDKLDVIELDTVREGSFYKTLIDHSSSDFPIVKITKVDSDKKFIEIEDKNGEKSFLDIRDAKIFSDKRYGKLEEGTSIQFRVKDAKSNEAKVISLLGDAKLRDSIVGILPSVDKAQRVGELVEVKNVNGVYHMVVKVDYNLFDEADKNGYATYIVADENVAGLKDLIGKKIAFKVFERNYNGLFVATDIRLNDADQTRVPDATLKGQLQAAADKYGDDFAKLTACSDLVKAEKEFKAIEAKYKALGLEKTTWGKENEAYKDAYEAFEAKLAAAKKAEKDATKKLTEAYNAIAKDSVIKLDKGEEKTLLKGVQNLVKADNVSVKEVKVVTTNANTATLKVTLAYKVDDKCSITKVFALAVNFECVEGTTPADVVPEGKVEKEVNSVCKPGEVCTKEVKNDENDPWSNILK
ncbi:S-layer homology domain-containing protein [uncultured Peptoniphilus sp.]|uniref:S-layer homology domain-containing protein n=1 Tax=uncultured Peptoniphilus sp. TaxID=254354 RepID=UPI0025F679DB|nr:S-layer homology domain-containing protein [uncultured Peptoniphilus sp.]